MSNAGLPRRDFLKISSLAAFGIAAGALRPDPLRAASANSGPPLLAVGYVENAPAAGAAVDMSSADSILSGDPTFISRGARLTFRSPGISDSDRSLGAAVDVLFPLLGFTAAQFPRYRAWFFARDDAGFVMPGNVSFNVPVTATRGLGLVLSRKPQIQVPQGPAGADESDATLTLGSDSGRLKLRRGVYAIAFRDTSNQQLPNWRAIRLVSKSGDLVVTPSPATYVLMSVDYGA